MRDYNARTSSRQPGSQRSSIRRSAPVRQQRQPQHIHSRQSNTIRLTGKKGREESPLAIVGKRCLGWLLAGTIVVLVVAGLLWLLRANMYQLHPMKQAVTLVILDPTVGNTTDLLVVQLATESKKVLVYRVKYQSETQLFSGYGTYPLASIYPLLKIDHKSDQYIRATLSAALGVMVDDIIPVPHMAQYVSLEKLEPHPQTVLTEVLRSYWFHSIAGVSMFERWQWLSYLEKLDLTWVVDQENKVFTDGFRFEPKYQLKNCSVAVVNTTMVKGLARRISNVLDGSGLTVIRTAADQVVESDSVVLYDPDYPDCQPLVSYVEQALPSYAKAQPDQATANRFRASIVVILGKDLTNN